MPKVHRLTEAKDFVSTRREGQAWSDEYIVLVVKTNGLDISRVGYSVGRRLGNAVVRNKTKRRLREVVRHVPIQEGWDFILIARKYASSADYHSFGRSVMSLVRRAGILSAAPRRADFSTQVDQ